MKRFLLVAFAAAVTVAFVAPASAADVTVGGEYRLRGENMNNKDFDLKANDASDFWAQRARLSATAKSNEDTTVKITIQDTRTFGKSDALTAGATSVNANGGPALTDTGNNTLDVHEAYLNVDKLAGLPVSLKVGRQELAYGDQRLIGAFGWSNNGRSFDAIKLGYKMDMVNADVFLASISDGATTGSYQVLAGAYVTAKPMPEANVDVYFLDLRDNNYPSGPIIMPVPGPTGNAFGFTGQTVVGPQNLYTVGFRVAGAAAGADYTFELPYQFGGFDNYDATGTIKQAWTISAMAFALNAGYTVVPEQKVRVGFGYNYASGDKDKQVDAGAIANGDKKIGTFFNLFPTNHGKFGNMDMQGWRNVHAINVNVSAEPMAGTKVALGFWNLSKASINDSRYSAAQWNGAGTANPLDTTGKLVTSKAIGNEIDVTVSHKLNSSTTLEAGYSAFLPGDNILGAAPYKIAVPTKEKANAQWGYLQISSSF